MANIEYFSFSPNQVVHTTFLFVLNTVVEQMFLLLNSVRKDFSLRQLRKK